MLTKKLIDRSKMNKKRSTLLATDSGFQTTRCGDRKTIIKKKEPTVYRVAK